MSEAILVFTIVLAAAFVGGELFYRIFGVSRVLGQIVAGIVLGLPFFRNALFTGSTMDVLSMFSAFGILFLLLLTGMEADFNRMRKSGREAATVAFFGAVIPAVLGFVLMKLLGYPSVVAFVLGASLALTSEGTKMAVLMEAKVLRTRLGSIMLGAGIMDDLFEIIFLAIVIILAHKSSLIDIILLPVHVAFFIAAAFILFKLIRKALGWFVDRNPEANDFMLIVLLGMVIASLSTFLGFGPIIGAFLAGAFVQFSLRKQRQRRKERNLAADLKTMTFGFVVPFFFVFIGLNFDVSSFFKHPLLFALVLLVAMAGKLLGSLISAFYANLSFTQSLLIGWGMNSRGAVELVIAEVARESGIIPPEVYSAIVAMAIITTLAFPLAMRYYLRKYPKIMQ